VRKLTASLALGLVLAASLASGASAHAKYRRVWVRDEWGHRVLVCEQYGRVHYGHGGYAWYPVPCHK
jgi:opacity protein-like surface antigen